jgi:hypothetical protein
MTEITQFAVGFLILFATGFGCWLASRDAAERRAAATIADLRHQLRVQSLDNGRLRERLNTIPRGDARRLDGKWL